MKQKDKCLLCCFTVCVYCGCRNLLISRNAFYPPDCSYNLVEKQQNDGVLKQYELLFKTIDENEEQKLPDIDDIKVECYKIVGDQNEQSGSVKQQSKIEQSFIPVVRVKYLNKKNHRNQLILHSHANSTDIGYQMNSYLDLALNLRVDVIGYDYSGYGISYEQKLSDAQIIQNILNVYKFITESLQYQWKNIILYGQSLGSGPSTLLASLREKPVGGLILHSAFSSGIRTLIQDKNNTINSYSKSAIINMDSPISQNYSHILTMSSSSYLEQPQMTSQYTSDKNTKLSDLHKFDFFPNYFFIKYVNCPILLIHGSNDQMIPLSHMQQLLNNIKSSTFVQKVILQGAGHNNIDTNDVFRKQYFQGIRQFFTSIKNLQSGMRSSELLVKNQASYWEKFNHIYYQQLLKIGTFQSIKTQNISSSQININLVEGSRYSFSSINKDDLKGCSIEVNFNQDKQNNPSNQSNSQKILSENQESDKQESMENNQGKQKDLIQAELTKHKINNSLDSFVSLEQNQINLHSQTQTADELQKQIVQNLLNN